MCCVNSLRAVARSPARTASRIRQCCLAIADRGRGIAEQEQKKIFNMFYRIRRKDENIRGTGLGLFIVNATVRRHHGTVSVESKGKGQGTTFRIHLPLAQPEDQGADL